MGKRSIAALLVVLVAVGGGAWWWWQRDAASQTQSERGPRRVAVELGPVTRDRAVERFRTVGAVFARDSVALTVEVSGIVATVDIDDNAMIEAGEQVLELEREDEEAAVAAAEASLAEARAELDRARELLREDVVAEDRVETARAAFENAGANLEQARVRLRNRRVLAPFSGRVGVVEVSPGTYLTPGDPITSLYSVDALEVRFDVPQRIAARIEAGASARLPAHDLDLEVASLTPAAASATRTFTAIAPLGDGPPPTIRPGEFVDVALTVDVRDDALFVAETAILRVGERSFVFRAGDGRAERVEVTTGVRREGRIEVRGPLDVNDEVVVAGIEKLEDGTPITTGGADA